MEYFFGKCCIIFQMGICSFMAEWVLEESDIFASRFKRFQKKHRNETMAVLNNLDTYFHALNSGVKPSLIQGGFIHREPQGVVAQLIRSELKAN